MLSIIEEIMTCLGYAVVVLVVVRLTRWMVTRVRRRPHNAVMLTLTMPMSAWDDLGKLKRLSECRHEGQVVERALAWYDHTLRAVAAGSKVAIVDRTGLGTFIDVR